MKSSNLGYLACANALVLAACLWGMSATQEAQASQDEQATADLSHPARSALDAFSENLTSLSARFEQSTHEGDGYVIDRSSGVFYFQSPNHFRWSYSEPIAEIIVGDGEQLWHYDPSLEQATVRAQPSAADSPILALTNPSLMSEAYAIFSGERADLLEFVPKSSDAPIEQARVRMENGQPVAVEWADGFGQITRIVFSEMAVNPVLDSALFQFMPPAGVDVLEGL